MNKVLEKQLLAIVMTIKKMQKDIKNNNTLDIDKIINDLKLEYDKKDKKEYEAINKELEAIRKQLEAPREQITINEYKDTEKIESLSNSLKIGLDSIEQKLYNFINKEDLDNLIQAVDIKIGSIKIPKVEKNKEPIIKIGKVRTIQAGDDASVDIRKVKGEYILDFNIPRGVSGKGQPGANATINGSNTLDIKAGTNVTIDQVGTDLTINATSGSGTVESVVAGENISVDSTDPANPIVSSTPYTLPEATTTVLGGVKPDGTTITATDGVISAVAGGVGTVTSVAVSGSDGIEVDSGSPITSSGTIALGVNKTTMLSTLNVEDGAEVNNISDINATDLTDGGETSLHTHSYDDLNDLPTIPTSHTELTDIGTNTHAQIDTAIAKFNNDVELQREPTGFTNCENVVVSYDSSTRKITLTGTFVAYYKGNVVTALTNGWTSDAHPTVLDKTYFLYYDGTNFIFNDTPFTYDQLQIAYVQYGTNDKIALKETHGFMPWQSHTNFHETIGTHKESGGTLSDYTLSSTTATNRRPNVSSTIIKDEDLQHTISALTTKKYTQKYLSGAVGTRTFVTNASEIIPVNGNIPYYNQYTGGAWQQTPIANNNYATVWVTAIPVTSDAGSQLYKYIFTQPQSTGSIAEQRNLTPTDLNIGDIDLLVPEFVFIAKIIIYVYGNNWTIEEVTNLTGNRYNQTGSPSGTYLSIVSHDTTLTGSGTVTDPLIVANPVTPETNGFSITAGTTPKTLTVPLDASVSGTNTGDQDLSGKQDLLVSGTNIKTINSTSLLGSGNIDTPNTTYVASDFAHNSLSGLNDGDDYEHITQAQKDALHSAVTVTDSDEIDFTLTGQDITAVLKSGSIDETKLDTSVNASLDKADSALQTTDIINDLTTGGTTDALSAEQGKVLNTKIEGAWTSFTPSWTNLTVGSGTNVGAYRQIGKTVHFRVTFTFAANSSVSGSITLTLPVTINTGYGTVDIIGEASVLAGATAYPLKVNRNGTVYAESTGGLYNAFALTSSTVPVTWANTHILNITGTYEAA